MASSIAAYLVLILLSNYFIPLKNLHYVHQLISMLSIPKYAFEAIALLEYGFGRCGPREIQVVLAWMDLQDEDYFTCIAMLAFHVVLYRSIAFWLLVRKANSRT